MDPTDSSHTLEFRKSVWITKTLTGILAFNNRRGFWSRQNSHKRSQDNAESKGAGEHGSLREDKWEATRSGSGRPSDLWEAEHRIRHDVYGPAV